MQVRSQENLRNNEFSGSSNPQKTRAGEIPMTKTIMMKMKEQNDDYLDDFDNDEEGEGEGDDDEEEGEDCEET